jgi:hypothetical protein
MSMLTRVRARLAGAPVALPGPLDRWSERWWSLPNRARHLAVLAAIALLLAGGEWRVRRAQAAWGGPPRRALVAVEAAAVGQRPRLRTVELPPAIVPPGAPAAVDGGVRLALALPEGGVLTRAHLSPKGPAAGLPAGLRVVPLPVSPGTRIVAGGRVDVWIAAAAPDGSRRIAGRRPVVGVRGDDERVALVGLSTAEVAAAVQGLADGEVLLTHAPP